MKIKSKKDYEIPIKEYKPNNVEKIIIACHGFGGDKESFTIQLLAQKLIKKGILVIAFDFPGHGESEDDGKNFTVENCINDLISVEEYAKKQYKQVPIGIFATSYGAYITLLKLNKYENNYFSIVLRAPAICMDKVFKKSIIRENMNNFKQRGYTILGYEKQLIVTYRYYEDLINNKIFEIYNKNEELLIIHGTEDTIAPITDSIKFIKEKNKKGQIKQIIGANHRIKNKSQLNILINISTEYIIKGDL